MCSLALPVKDAGPPSCAAPSRRLRVRRKSDDPAFTVSLPRGMHSHGVAERGPARQVMSDKANLGES